MLFNDYFSHEAANYARYRPDYPLEMITYIVSKCSDTKVAWDCATGTGQAAHQLALFFQKIIATDASERQIAMALPHPRIYYQVCFAENTGLPDDIFDLITVAQAVHWFDLEKFHKEAVRVAKPNGILAVWTYSLPSVEMEIDKIVNVLYEDILGPFWPAERRWVEIGYRDLPLPGNPIEAPAFYMYKSLSYEEYVGYLNTWSAVYLYYQIHGHHPIQHIETALLEAWGDADCRRPVRWPLYLKMTRIQKPT